MKKSLLIALALFIGAVTFAQEKKELTLSDAVLKAGTDLAPKNLKALQWIAGSDQYSYVKENQLWRGGVGKVADQAIVTIDDLNKWLNEEAQVKGFPGITWLTPTTFRFEHNERVYRYDVEKKALSEQARFTMDSEDLEHEDEQGRLAFTMDNNVFIAPHGGERLVRVTNDGTDGIVNGKSVHRQEYGIEKGLFWSPKGNALAFYRMDESMVTPYQLEDISTQPSTFKKIRYPMAGQASHHVTIGVYDLKTAQTVFLNTGEPADQYLTNIAWDPSESFIYVVHLDRATDHLRVVQYDVKTGNAMRTLFEEKDSKYLEPLHPMQFLKRSPSKYLWWSQRDGWAHLYLYDLKEGLVRQLTTGKWEVTNVLGLDEKETTLFVQGTGDQSTTPAGAMDSYIYRVTMATGATQRITSESGTHGGSLSGSSKYILDSWSSLKVPGRSVIRDGRGTVVKTLNDAPDPLADLRTGTIELLQIPGENGDQLNARLIEPSGFDSRNKYPVIVYVYNGPHVQLVTNSWLGGASLWMLHAAERGYLVFTVDGHGSDDRGRDFEQVIYRQLGTVEVKDQLHGADWLRAQPFVDGERMAVHGWSYGGFMTTSLMVKAPGTFKVGVAGGPVMDWAMYEVMYTERYMDTPQENPDGYANAALAAKAGDLKGDLLLIHGGQDDTVLPEHSFTFLKSCVDKGVQVDLFVYPGHPHNVRGKDRLHLMTKVLDYVDEKLGVVGK